MPRRDRRHPGRWWWTAAPVVLVLAVLVAAAVVVWLPADPDPRQDPAAVAPPPGLELPEVAAPAPVGEPADPAAPDPAAVRRAVAARLSDPDLGRHVVALVAGLTGRPAYRLGDGAAIPASTTKLLTCLAALDLLEPGTTFDTTVVRAGRTITLVGGGDPFLERAPEPPGTQPVVYPARADVTTLARRAARALRADGLRRVRLAYDDTLFTGPEVNPRWRADYVPGGIVSPITALWVDEGREGDGSGRVGDPAATAAAVFGDALQRAGVRVTGQVAARAAPPDAAEVAAVSSAPVGEIVEQVLQVSDNEAAEVLLRHVGIADGAGGSFAGGVRGVRNVLERHDVPQPEAMWDGSGLSRQGLISPATLVGVLRTAALAPDDSPLRTLLAGLPVAGFTGSLTYRMADPAPAAGRGRTRAKTGTLTNVSSLAGLATTPDGTVLVFALMADEIRVPRTLAARDALDAAAAALGACRCAARGG